VSYERSSEITDKINHGDMSDKPGWVRWSLHPTMTDAEVQLFIEALKDIVKNIGEYQQNYVPVPRANTYRHKDEKNYKDEVRPWFNLD